jgi:hypothetical protein
MLNKAVRENRQRAIAEERKRQSALKATEKADANVWFWQNFVYILVSYFTTLCSVCIVCCTL